MNNNSNSGNNGLPSTGGTSPAAVGLFGTIVSLLGAFMVKKKNSKN
ncbi:MAG: LPXTG cell wall anchor domain-containing protein [Clostridium sp.]|nr:LPXTG cell wall anchor domain-containing protein [Clostridium sp.]